MITNLNYKDNKLKALDLLERDGNPFEFSIYDFEGRLAIDLGVYGAPETFFIDKKKLINLIFLKALLHSSQFSEVTKSSFDMYY